MALFSFKRNKSHTLKHMLALGLLVLAALGASFAARPTAAFAEDTAIFTAKDNSKLEQFKARVFNGLIDRKQEIDVSDIGITEKELVFPNITATGRMGFIGYIRTSTSLISTYCISYSGLTFTYSGNNISTVKVQYLTTWTEAAMSAFKKSYTNFWENAPHDGSDLQKALYVHDWICSRTSYSTSATYADTALGVMVDGRALCAGFSYAYQFLAEQLNLECNYVSGTTKVESHAWNKVKVEGQWFLVDSTWDRALTTSTTYSHTFFLVNDTEFKLVGNKQHDSDKDVINNDPINICYSFANKFWADIYGPIESSMTTQNANLTVSHTWDSGTVTKEPTCAAKGVKTYTCTGCGATKTEDIAKTTTHTWDGGKITKEPTTTEKGIRTFTCTICGYQKTETIPKLTPSTPTKATITMYRLYNPYSGEHFYTSDNNEKSRLVNLGWRDEGVGWTAPAPEDSNTPVYRLYNPYVTNGDHHYTTDKKERDNLESKGWTYEGIGWYSDDAKGVPLYRQYNPFAATGTHNYTANKSENDYLVSVGWKPEGISWYGIK